MPVILPSPPFVRASKRLRKRQPDSDAAIQVALQLLAIDPHHPLLKTHKLHGGLQNSWACSAGYDVRIVFRFVQHEGQEAILLQTVGTHEEAY
jgi:mRNA-degrading endonuclease YafQ of YafQ-DinJ toxin-antitoxin module